MPQQHQQQLSSFIDLAKKNLRDQKVRIRVVLLFTEGIGKSFKVSSVSPKSLYYYTLYKEVMIYRRRNTH